MRQKILDRIEALAAEDAPAATVLAGRFDPPKLASGKAAIVIRAEDAGATSDIDAYGLRVGIWVLAPLKSETVKDYPDKYKKAASLAESTILSLERALEGDAGHTWAAARRAGGVEQRLSRPQPDLLCAEASAEYIFAKE